MRLSKSLRTISRFSFFGTRLAFVGLSRAAGRYFEALYQSVRIVDTETDVS